MKSLEEIKIIKTKMLEGQGLPIHKKLMVTELKQAVKKTEKQSAKEKELKTEDKTLDGLPMETWKVALSQLKAIIESQHEKKKERPIDVLKPKRQEVLKNMIEVHCECCEKCADELEKCLEKNCFFKQLKNAIKDSG